MAGLQALLRQCTFAMTMALCACQTLPNVQPATYNLKVPTSTDGAVVGTVMNSDFFGVVEAFRFNFLSPTGEEIHVLPVDGKGRSTMRVNMVLLPGGQPLPPSSNHGLFSDAEVSTKDSANMRGSAFALSLPPGIYRVQGFSIQRRGRWESFNQTQNMLEFRVNPGQIQYVGRFMFDTFCACAEVRNAWPHDESSVRRLAYLENARIENSALTGAWTTPMTADILRMARETLKSFPVPPKTPSARPQP